MTLETNCVWLLGVNFPAFFLQKIFFHFVEASKNISQDSFQPEFSFFPPYLTRAEEFHPLHSTAWRGDWETLHHHHKWWINHFHPLEILHYKEKCSFMKSESYFKSIPWEGKISSSWKYFFLPETLTLDEELLSWALASPTHWIKLNNAEGLSHRFLIPKQPIFLFSNTATLGSPRSHPMEGFPIVCILELPSSPK